MNGAMLVELKLRHEDGRKVGITYTG